MPPGGHAPPSRQLGSWYERGEANQGDREDDAENGVQLDRHLADVRGVDRDNDGDPAPQFAPKNVAGDSADSP